jgi:hypothetical protein
MGLFSLLPVIGILLATMRHGPASAAIVDHGAMMAQHAANLLDPGHAIVAAMLLVLSIRLTRSTRRR